MSGNGVMPVIPGVRNLAVGAGRRAKVTSKFDPTALLVAPRWVQALAQVFPGGCPMQLASPTTMERAGRG